MSAFSSEGSRKSLSQFLNRTCPGSLRKKSQRFDEVIDVFKNATAAFASGLSHDELAWELAREMEELPPDTFLLTRADLAEDDLAWAQKVSLR